MPDPHPLLSHDPRSVGGYKFLGRLAVGGQGVVYLGRSSAGRLVAVKLLHPEWVAASGGRLSLAREVAAARQVGPFCTAQVLDAKVGGDLPYIVSEFVDGPSLLRYVEQFGPLAGPSLDRFVIATAAALVAIHSAGVVHREVKPANVLIGSDGARVIDFGVAHDPGLQAETYRLTPDSPLYLAPEQLSGEPVGPSADVFSWVSTVAFAATGRAPFEGATAGDVIDRIISGRADLAGVPGELAGVVESCLNLDPDRRPTARQTLSRLLGSADPGPESADPTPMLLEATRILRSGQGPRVSRAIKAPPMSAPPQPAPPMPAPPIQGQRPAVKDRDPLDAVPVDAVEPSVARVPPQSARPQSARPTPTEHISIDGLTDTAPLPLPPLTVGASADLPQPWWVPSAAERPTPSGTARSGRSSALPDQSLRQRMSSPGSLAILGVVALIGMVGGVVLGMGGFGAMLGRSSAAAVSSLPAPAAPTAAATVADGAPQTQPLAPPVDVLPAGPVSAIGRGCTVTYRVVQQWTGGFKGEVTVKAPRAAVNGWVVRWKFRDGQAVTQAWNTTLASAGTTVTAQNAAWNGAIAAGATTTFGFLGAFGGVNGNPSITCAAR